MSEHARVVTDRLRILVALLAVSLVASACGIPRDMRGTMEQARARGTVRAGAIAGAPDIHSDAASGIAVEVVDGFAASLGLDTRWEVDSEHELMHRLEEGELDVVVGGVDRTTPWVKIVSLSRVMGPEADGPVAAVRMGENAWLLSLDRWIEGNTP